MGFYYSLKQARLKIISSPSTLKSDQNKFLNYLQIKAGTAVTENTVVGKSIVR